MDKRPLILRLLGVAVGAALLLAGAPAHAQQKTDEPQLSPMLFGPTQKELKDKIRKEEADEEEAQRISYEQDQDRQHLDEPKLRPLTFGRTPDEEEYERTGGRISENKGDAGFFSAFNFLIPETTNLSVGLGPVYRPDYLGSDDYTWDVDPQVYIRFRNFLFLDDDGVDIALFGFNKFKLGPTMRLRAKRDESDNPALQGLGDVGRTFEFGGFAATTFLNRFAVKAKVRKGIDTGHRGVVVEGYITALIFRTDALSLSATAQAAWVGQRYADTYFSVTPEQSLNSGGRLPVYESNRGLRDFGVSATAYINLFDRWSLNPYATYTYIYDDFADAPIIALYGDRDQFRVGFHLMREFVFGAH